MPDRSSGVNRAGVAGSRPPPCSLVGRIRVGILPGGLRPTEFRDWRPTGVGTDPPASEDRNGSASNPVDPSDSARLRRVQPLPPGQGRDITGRERTPPTHSNEHFLHGTARCARPPSYHRTARCSRELSDILPKRMSPCSPAPSGAMIPTPQNGVKHQMFV